jgi:hypothetical protein
VSGRVATSLFGAGPPGLVTAWAGEAARYAMADLGPIEPLAVLEWEPAVLRERLGEANQPEASITALERLIAANPGWVLFELRFMSLMAAHDANPRSYLGGAGGRRQ